MLLTALMLCEEEFSFNNQKHFHSITVQIICDVDMVLTNAAQWSHSFSKLAVDSGHSAKKETAICTIAMCCCGAHRRASKGQMALLQFHRKKI